MAGCFTSMVGRIWCVQLLEISHPLGSSAWPRREGHNRGPPLLRFARHGCKLSNLRQCGQSAPRSRFWVCWGLGDSAQRWMSSLGKANGGLSHVVMYGRSPRTGGVPSIMAIPMATTRPWNITNESTPRPPTWGWQWHRGYCAFKIHDKQPSQYNSATVS